MNEDTTIAVNWQPDDGNGETGTLDVVVRHLVPTEYVTIEIDGEGQR